MLAIPLNDGSFTVVDDWHFDELTKFSWENNNGYCYTLINGKNVSMSRYIMNAKKGEIVDHINGNSMINTDDNLRICTSSQNRCNTSISTRNTSGEKCVFLDKKSNKWKVSIVINKKSFHFGKFTEKEDAIAASRQAIKKIHGEFARLEEPEIDFTEIYMAKWNPKSINIFSKKKEQKSQVVVNVFENYAEVLTTKDQWAKISIEDAAVISCYKWHADYNNHTNSFYAKSEIRDENGIRHHVSMHRLIMNAKKGEIVDHINGNTMDDSRINLRIVTRCQNAQNHKMSSLNTSGTTGVTYRKENGKWRAYYSLNGKKHYLGDYLSKEEAIEAREKVIENAYGDFRRKE